jgi:hypothetical protein
MVKNTNGLPRDLLGHAHASDELCIGDVERFAGIVGERVCHFGVVSGLTAFRLAWLRRSFAGIAAQARA